MVTPTDNGAMRGSRPSTPSLQSTVFGLCVVFLLANVKAFHNNIFPTRGPRHDTSASSATSSFLPHQRQGRASRPRSKADQPTALLVGKSYLNSINTTARISKETDKQTDSPVAETELHSTVDDHTAAQTTTVSKARQEAEELRRRAKELLAEAIQMETSLKETRSTERLTRMSESNNMIDHLFSENRPLTPEAIARVLRDERWSFELTLMVLEHLHGRQTRTLNLDRESMAGTKPNFQIGDTRNAISNSTESDLFDSYIECLIDAASILDEEQGSQDEAKGSNKRWPGRVASALKSRLNELRRTEELSARRNLALTINGAMNSNTTMQDYMRQTLGLSPIEGAAKSRKHANITRGLERIALVPLWVPSSLISSMIASQALIDAKDVRTIKDQVLWKSEFFCTSSQSIPSAALFRGNVRPRARGSTVVGGAKNETAIVFQELQIRLQTEGLADRIQLFFLQDPEWQPSQDPLGPRPVVLALAKAVVPHEAQQRSPATILKRVSTAMTLVTAFFYSVACYALNPIFFESVVNKKDLTVLVGCIPLFVGVLAIQVVHELAHYLVAKARGIKIGFPVPIPAAQLGSFGSITPLRSFPPNRAALLDFALSGPVAAMGLSFIALITGIYQTVYASESALSHFPVVPLAMLKSSFLTGSLLSFLAPKAMMMPLSQPIPIHPLFMIGFSGLISSALNLLPIFRLDGGRACSAALGNRIGAIASAGTLLFLLSLTLSGGTGLAFAWGIFVIFFQRHPEIPVRDEVTEVDDFRLGAWIASLATSILALVPFPGGPWFL